MDVTSLKRLLEEKDVTTGPNGLTVRVQPSWIVPGEDRLSYTTLTRLVECCRELHWNTDIVPRAGDSPLDSITKSLTANFIKPIEVESVISITYRVTEVHKKGYSIRFEVRNSMNHSLCAVFDLVSVFYDSVTHRSLNPPASVLEYLLSICVQNNMKAE